jgi:hypothetical protein
VLAMDAILSSGPNEGRKSTVPPVAVERRHTAGSDLRVKLGAHGSDY